MYIITVEFQIANQYLVKFMNAMRQQAKNSVDLEEDCHLFDVAVSEENPHNVFLYEIYTNKAAFEAHLASAHFTDFNREVSDWVMDKKVSGWNMDARGTANSS